MVVDTDTNNCLCDDNVDGNVNIDLNIGDLWLHDSESQSMHDNDNNKSIDEDGDDVKKTANMCKRRVVMDDEDDDLAYNHGSTNQSNSTLLEIT